MTLFTQRSAGEKSRLTGGKATRSPASLAFPNHCWSGRLQCRWRNRWASHGLRMIDDTLPTTSRSAWFRFPSLVALPPAWRLPNSKSLASARISQQFQKALHTTVTWTYRKWQYHRNFLPGQRICKWRYAHGNDYISVITTRNTSLGMVSQLPRWVAVQQLQPLQGWCSVGAKVVESDRALFGNVLVSDHPPNDEHLAVA